jgi:hypothetical protein
MTAIQHVEAQIRDLINAPRRQAVLLANIAAWTMLCSSLDVIGDTELAIEAYLEAGARPHETEGHGDRRPGPGENYLTLYGILQVLFVQQDAVQHLAEALGIDYAHDPVLKGVRDNRNDAIGHPTNRRGGKAFNFISRITLSRAGCRLMTVSADGKSEFKTIDVPALIAAQRQSVSTALTGILAQLAEDETAHRRKFRGIKLADIFSPLSYCHEKISDSIRANLPDPLGAGMLEDVVACIAEFKSELGARSPLDAYEGIAHELAELDYPITKLGAFFSPSSALKVEGQDAAIHHFFIYTQLESLRSMAREIDRDYEHDV